MLDQTGKTRESNTVDLVVDLFPNADPRIVSSLTSQDEALRKYLAEHNDLTRAEVDEVMDSFLPYGAETALYQASA